MVPTIQSGTFPPHIKLFEAVNQCLVLFQKYVDSDRPLSRRYASILEQRLRTWAKYSGATSRQGLSLDDRLDSLSDIKQAVLSLLHMVLSNLSKAFDLVDEEVHEPDHDHVAVKVRHVPSMLHQDTLDSGQAEAEDKWKSYQGTAWEAVSAAIDMLFEMASAIRNSGNPSIESQVPIDFRRDDDNYFDIIAKTLVRKRFPHARRSLTDQIGYSIFVRRRRILYQQKHAEKLAFPRALPRKDSTDAAVTALPRRFEALQRPVQQNKLVPRPHVQTDEPSIVAPSLTDISRAQPRTAILRRLQAPTVVTGRTRGAVATEQARPEYPEPPSSNEKYAVCPYCGTVLLTSQLRGDNWIKHVNQDLKPFICLSEKCQEPPRFYVSKKDWAQHMENYHSCDWYQKIHMTTWFCNIDHLDNLEFFEAVDLKNHLSEQHGVSDHKQKALVRRNRGLGCRETGCCPLCEDKPKISNGTDSTQSTQALMEHIAEHLQSIALVSLPAADYVPTSKNDDEDNNERGSNRAGVIDLSASLSTRSALSSLHYISNAVAEDVPLTSSEFPMPNLPMTSDVPNVFTDTEHPQRVLQPSSNLDRSASDDEVNKRTKSIGFFDPNKQIVTTDDRFEGNLFDPAISAGLPPIDHTRPPCQSCGRKPLFQLHRQKDTFTECHYCGNLEQSANLPLAVSPKINLTLGNGTVGFGDVSLAPEDEIPDWPSFSFDPQDSHVEWDSELESWPMFDSDVFPPPWNPVQASQSHVAGSSIQSGALAERQTVNNNVHTSSRSTRLPPIKDLAATPIWMPYGPDVPSNPPVQPVSRSLSRNGRPTRSGTYVNELQEQQASAVQEASQGRPVVPASQKPGPVYRDNTESDSFSDYRMQLMLLEQQTKRRQQSAYQERGERIHEQQSSAIQAAHQVTAPASFIQPDPINQTQHPSQHTKQEPLSDYQMQLLLLEQQNKKKQQQQQRRDDVFADYQMQLLLIEQQKEQRNKQPHMAQGKDLEQRSPQQQRIEPELPRNGQPDDYQMRSPYIKEDRLQRGDSFPMSEVEASWMAWQDPAQSQYRRRDQQAGSKLAGDYQSQGITPEESPTETSHKE